MIKLNFNKIKLQMLPNIIETYKLNTDIDYDITIKEHKEKRSIDQNSYYWLLLEKFADWSRQDKMYLHNQMIAHYGQMFNKWFARIPITEDVYNNYEVHLRPTSRIERGTDGIEYRYCYIMRGSSTYDTYEMSVLIDGLINEIKGSNAPIQTLTEEELKQLQIK